MPINDINICVATANGSGSASSNNILFKSNFSFDQIIKKLNSKIFTNYYFRTEKLNQDLRNFLKKAKIKEKKTNNLDKNATSDKNNENIFKFFNKKNLQLIEKKEKYIFDKFKYKKISKNAK